MAEIPNSFHFIFGLKPQTEPFHVVHYLCLESCRRVNRPQAMHLHYHYEPYGPWWERIAPHLNLHRVEPVHFITRSEAYWRHAEGAIIRRANLDYAHQADFLRLQVLTAEGGVYADMDTLFVNRLPESLFGREFVIGTEGVMPGPDGGEKYESLCNALILSRPGAEFGRCWLDEMYHLFDGTWNRHSCYGASMLRRRMPHAVHVVPRRYFYRYRPTSDDIALLLQGRDTEASTDIYSIHLWGHLWWEPSRMDFSSCHKGVLSEEFIRTADTTYNVLARPFLE